MFTLTCSDSNVILSNAIYTGWGKIVPVKTDCACLGSFRHLYGHFTLCTSPYILMSAWVSFPLKMLEEEGGI